VKTPAHPLARHFQPTLDYLASILSASTHAQYRHTVRHFLSYLRARHPQVRALAQLRRDPHIFGWLAALWSQQPPLAKSTRAAQVIRLRRLLEELAASGHALPPGLVLARDIPRPDTCLPRPLAAEHDALLQRYLESQDDLRSGALRLLRHTGMRIGECLDLADDCLRLLAPEQWAIHVPLGKLHTERWVPVDRPLAELVRRLRFLAAMEAPRRTDPFLLPRPLGREYLAQQLRLALSRAATAAGLATHVVPHQLRHTYATEMLRAGVSFPAVMKLLGHTSPRMTLRYVEVTQTDLQREYQRARSQPRYCLPPPPSAMHPLADSCVSLSRALNAAHHAAEMLRRGEADPARSQLLARAGNRLAKIIALVRGLDIPEN
jgi:site-specific recombinase XerD